MRGQGRLFPQGWGPRQGRKKEEKKNNGKNIHCKTTLDTIKKSSGDTVRQKTQHKHTHAHSNRPTRQTPILFIGLNNTILNSWSRAMWSTSPAPCRAHPLRHAEPRFAHARRYASRHARRHVSHHAGPSLSPLHSSSTITSTLIILINES